VFIRHLPPDSAVAYELAGNGWTIEHYLMADLYHTWAGKPHPADPRGFRIEAVPDAAKLRDLKRRQAERKARLEGA
jgi:hypothetical protein